jgi:hypothetical protein
METTSTSNLSMMDDKDMAEKKIDVLELVDQAKKLVKTSKKLPLTNRVLVDQESLLKVLEDIHRALPADVKQASQVLRRRERIINQALAEAHRILVANAEEMENSAQQHNIVVIAEKRASDIIKQAEVQVRLMMADATKQITVPRDNTSHAFARFMRKLGKIISALFGRKTDKSE